MQEEKGIGFPTVGGEWHDPNKQQKQQPQQQQPGPQQPQQQPSNRPQANTQQGESPLGVNGNDGQYHTDPTTTYKLRGVSNG